MKNQDVTPMKSNASPPRFFQRFFRWYCDPRLTEHIEGDLLEEYGIRLKQSGRRKADMKFIIDIILLFRPGIIRTRNQYNAPNPIAMYKNYFKIALRNLVKNKGYSAINIGGLAVGMAVAMFIGLWIRDEVSFNTYFENRKHLAQVMINQTHEGKIYTGTTVQMPLGDALRTGYASDIKAVSLTSWNHGVILSNGETKIPGTGMWVQHDFPHMFSLKMLSGNRNALHDPSTMLISKSLSIALFGKDDPLHKSLRVGNKFDMVVGGVYEDFPSNTTFRYTQLLMSWENKENWMNTKTDWMNHCGQLFVQLSDGVDLNQINEKIKGVPTPHISQWKEEAMLHPLIDLHLYNKFENGKVAGGQITFVWLFAIIGIFVLLLACINFMNLSTARSQKRAKEVGIRKTIGSVRSQLVNQFLSESVILAGIAFILSLVLVQTSSSFFSTLADKQIAIPWGNAYFWLMMFAFTLFTGLLAGSYPAFFLSRFMPVKILRGTAMTGPVASLPRKSLVVIQFTVSITLIIGTMIVFKQIQFAKNRSAGFTRDGLITIGLQSPELRKNAEVIKNELIQKGAIESMALSSQSPAHFSNNNGLEWRGKEPGLTVFFRNVGVTPDFGKTVGWTIVKGRDFSQDLPGDSASLIVNQKAAKVMGFNDPVGEIVEFHGKRFTIIGVAEDMLTQSPYAPNEPAFFITDDWMSVMIMRLNPSKPVSESLAVIKGVFNKLNPEAPFDFSFVDNEYARKFSNEERIGNLAGVFALLAIFISCLGLFGLASFVAEQRTKEIGIRKVLGATVTSLWKMLSTDFIVLTVIASCISIPISFLFMNQWLTQYEYRVPVTWEIFLIAATGTILLTLVTVSFQAVRAAVANPVRNLRSE